MTYARDSPKTYGRSSHIMIYLHKLLPLIVSPLGLVILLIILGMAFRRWIIVVLSCFVLLASALPVTAQLIWRGLEQQHPPRSLDRLGSFDAVVVLSGGMLFGLKYKGTFKAEWADPDRFFAGIEVLKSGKANTLIFTRGSLPWENHQAEGELLRIKAIEMGVDDTQIILTDTVSNTAEEALAVKDLMAENGINTILLITSSFHMPRAKLLFDKQGIDSDTFPVDFKGTGRQFTWLSFLPSANGFALTSSGVREYIGRLYYELKFA